MKYGIVLLSVGMLFIVGCGSGPSAAQKPATADNYPLNVCVVTGEKLGSMGEPFVVKYQGKTVKFCCSACLKDFNKDSSKYMAILEEAEKKSAPEK